MRKFLKVCTISVCILCCAAMQVWAGGGQEKAGAKGSKDVVTLKWYMSLNPIAPDTAKVIEKLNEYTREKIGVQIDYQVISNPDYAQKMPTIINSGQEFDMCFTASWTTNYLQFVDRGAFMDITDLLPKYAKETYNFIPKAMWNSVSVKKRIYGVPVYKELGWQGGFLINADMAKKYGIDLSKIKTLADYEAVLKTVKEKSTAEGKKVIGLVGMDQGFVSAYPYESVSFSSDMPGAYAVPQFAAYKDTGSKVFNQYASKEYQAYCEMVHRWYQAGYLAPDPVQYDTDIAQKDNDFQTGKVFSFFISYAPGYKESLSKSVGFTVEFIPLMAPLFETQNAMGGILALSYNSKHPDKVLEFINLLNTDRYVGTLIRHGIEGMHHSAVGKDNVDKTMGGKLAADKNGYDYTFGWQFGSPFNQKWDISYPSNIRALFDAYNKSSVAAPHVGFSFNPEKVSGELAGLKNVVEKYRKALESGMSDPTTELPKFLKELEANGLQKVLAESQKQINEFVK